MKDDNYKSSLYAAPVERVPASEALSCLNSYTGVRDPSCSQTLVGGALNPLRAS